MSTYKRIDGDYTIQSINSGDVVKLDSDRVLVTGNLEVTGNLTYINTTELEVTDPFVVLNRSNTSSFMSNAGILTHQTSTVYAGLRYNTDTGDWELSSNTDSSGETGSWSPITTGGTITPGGANTNIQFNDSGSFGGNNNFSYDLSNSTVNIDGSIVLNDQSVEPDSVANSVVMYANTAGSGGTGVYIKDDSVTDELVSKTKAIVFGIIF